MVTRCSERPKESEIDDLGEKPAMAQPQESRTTRLRYSGAVRRRYKKQLQREDGERAVQAGTQQTDANPPVTEEGGPSRAAKCSRSDPSTPSPSGVEQTKKSKVPEQKTYAQVAIVPMAYPDRKFKRSAKGRILDLVKGTKALIFQGTSDRDGAVIFNCVDVETVEWLKSLMTVLTIKEGLQLRALGASMSCPNDTESWCTWRTQKCLSRRR